MECSQRGEYRYDKDQTGRERAVAGRNGGSYREAISAGRPTHQSKLSEEIIKFFAGFGLICLICLGVAGQLFRMLVFKLGGGRYQLCDSPDGGSVGRHCALPTKFIGPNGNIRGVNFIRLILRSPRSGVR